MKKYLLLICLIFAITLGILKAKKSGTIEISSAPILNQEFTQSPTALPIQTIINNIWTQALLHLDDTLVRHRSKTYAGWNFGLELSNIRPENYIDDLIASLYKIEKGKLTNLHDSRSLAKRRNAEIKLNIHDGRDEEKIISLPKEPLGELTKLPDAFKVFDTRKSASIEIGIAKTWLSTQQILNQKFTNATSFLSIPTTVDDISASYFLNLDHSISARYMSPSYAGWNFGLELSAINPENWVDDFITSSYKVSKGGGKLDNFYEWGVLKKKGDMTIKLKFTNNKKKEENIIIPQDALDRFGKLATALETLHINKPELFVKNYYLDERGEEQSSGTYLVPLRSILVDNKFNNRAYRSDYIIEISEDAKKISLTQEAKKVLSKGKPKPSSSEGEAKIAYNLLVAAINNPDYFKQNEFKNLKHKQYFNHINLEDKTYMEFFLNKIFNTAFNILKALESKEFNKFGIDFLDSFIDKQKEKLVVEELFKRSTKWRWVEGYLDRLADFTYSHDAIKELNKAINSQEASQITDAIKNFYSSYFLSLTQYTAEFDRVLDKNMMAKLKVSDDGRYSYMRYKGISKNGGWIDAEWIEGVNIHLTESEFLQDLLLVQNPTKHKFDLDTLTVEVLHYVLTQKEKEINEAIDYLENLTFEGADVTQAVKTVFALIPVQYAFDISDNFGIYAGAKAGFGHLSIVQKSKTKADAALLRQAELICRQEGQTFNVGLEFGAIYSISDSVQAKAGVSWSACGICETKNELSILKNGTKDQISHDLLANLVERKAASLSGLSFDGLFGMQDLSLHLGIACNI